jgi:hypothetical protein
MKDFYYQIIMGVNILHKTGMVTGLLTIAVPAWR